jgi:muconolactone delta-isomerase
MSEFVLLPKKGTQPLEMGRPETSRRGRIGDRRPKSGLRSTMFSRRRVPRSTGRLCPRNVLVFLWDGRDDDAESVLLRAKELAQEYGSAESIALAHRVVGMWQAQTLFDADGEADRRAEESFLTSIDLLRQIGNEKEAARSLAELGHHLIERGDVEGYGPPATTAAASTSSTDSRAASTVAGATFSPPVTITSSNRPVT